MYLAAIPQYFSSHIINQTAEWDWSSWMAARQGLERLLPVGGHIHNLHKGHRNVVSKSSLDTAPFLAPGISLAPEGKRADDKNNAVGRDDSRPAFL